MHTLKQIYEALSSLLIGHEADIAKDVTYLGVTGSYVSYDISTGLVAHYTMNDNLATVVVADSKGTNTGTWVGPSTSGPQNTSVMSNAGVSADTGGDNGALSFDGSSDSVSAPGTVANNLAHTGSISMWVKSANTSQVSVFLGFKGTNEGTYALIDYTLYIDAGGNVAMGISDGSDADTATQSITWDTNWHLVTGTWDGSNVVTYVDGVAGTPITQTRDAQQVLEDPFSIGRASAGFFNGSIDDVRIYNTALT